MGSEQTLVNDEEKKQRIKKIQEARQAKINAIKKDCLTVLMSQTTLSEEEAVKLLEENSYNVQACVRIFMGLPPYKEKKTTYSSVNQGIFSEIRTRMDEAAHRYTMKKRYEERVQQIQEQRQAILQARAQQAKLSSQTSDSIETID